MFAGLWRGVLSRHSTMRRVLPPPLCRRMATAPDGEGEDYLKVHRPNMYWFPSKKPTPENDAREIGPYPPTPAPSNDPAQSFQLRPPDLPEYFDPQTRRRFGETLPEEADILSVWAPDVEGDYSLAYMLSGAVLFLATLGGIAYGFTVTHDPETTWRRFATEKELPYMDKYYSPDKPWPVPFSMAKREGQ